LTRANETGAGAHVYAYAYDLDGNLTEVAKDGVVAETYTYDVNGNPSRKLGAGDPAAATYDAQDRIVSRGGVAYAYDADGYLTGRGADTFTYGAQGELLSATVGATTVRYAYDGFGRMVARTDGAGTTQILYGNLPSPFQPTATRSPDGTLTRYFYDEDEKLFAFRRGSTWFYVATDQVGSPRVVTDAAGVAQKVLEYDAFGAVLSDSNPSFELPIGFAGGIADPATGLVRFGLRDYEPLAGRWTARDPILFSGAQANLYVYVGNNPISRRDPTGLFCVSASLYDGIGGGFSTCINGDGASFCAEAGVGIGASVDVDLFGAPEKTHGFAKFEAKVKTGNVGVGVEAKGFVDGAGCKGVDVKLKGQVGPVAPEAKIYDHDKGWFPGKGAVKGKGSVSPAPEIGSSKVGVGAQVKLAAGGCVNSNSW
jgi:RHS repeat-associated protein